MMKFTFKNNTDMFNDTYDSFNDSDMSCSLSDLSDDVTPKFVQMTNNPNEAHNVSNTDGTKETPITVQSREACRTKQGQDSFLKATALLDAFVAPKYSIFEDQTDQVVEDISDRKSLKCPERPKPLTDSLSDKQSVTSLSANRPQQDFDQLTKPRKLNQIFIDRTKITVLITHLDP